MEPIPKEDYISEVEYYDHWFTNEIADYVNGNTDRAYDIEWLQGHSDAFIFGADEGGEYFIVKNKEEYFKPHFKRFMEALNKIKDYTLEDFTEGFFEMWTLKDAYEDKFGFYVNADGETISLDSFVRRCATGEKYYIGATIDYHF
jgi:hypothetical protein